MENGAIETGPKVCSWSERSDSIAKLAAALAKFQSKLEAVKKDADNPFFKSKYADLASVWAAIREPLTANELSILQEPGTDSGRVTLSTTLLHSSGEYIRSIMTIPVTKPDAQGYGSAITYARRYALQSIAGVAPEDDDGNAAVGPQKQPQSARPGPAAPLPAPRAPTAEPVFVQPRLHYYDLSKVDPRVKDATIQLFIDQGAEQDPDTFLYVTEGPIKINGAEPYEVQPPAPKVPEAELVDESTGEVVKESVMANATRARINKVKGTRAA